MERKETNEIRRIVEAAARILKPDVNKSSFTELIRMEIISFNENQREERETMKEIAKIIAENRRKKNLRLEMMKKQNQKMLQSSWNILERFK